MIIRISCEDPMISNVEELCKAMQDNAPIVAESHANFSFANLPNAQFPKAVFHEAVFSNSNLCHSNLSKLELS